MRALRKCIYNRGQKYDKTNGTGDDEIISLTNDYDADVRNFVYNYREILSSREVEIWEEKLKETTIFAIKCLGYMPESEDGYPLFESYDDDEEYDTEDIKPLEDDSIHAEVKGSIEAKEIPAKKTCDSSCQVSLTCEEGQNHFVGQFFDSARERKSLSDDAMEISEAVLVPNLANVPLEEFSNPIDLDIETRLEKIRSFNQTLLSEFIPHTNDVVESTLVETPSGKPKRNMVEVRETSSEAVYSSQEDIKNFNSW